MQYLQLVASDLVRRAFMQSVFNLIGSYNPLHVFIKGVGCVKFAENTLVALCNIFECHSPINDSHVEYSTAVLLSHKSGTGSPCEFCCREAG